MSIARRFLIVAAAVTGVLALAASPLSAASDSSSERAPVLRRPSAATAEGKMPQAATATAYSTEVPLVARIAPTAAVDCRRARLRCALHHSDRLRRRRRVRRLPASRFAAASQSILA